jgi:archaellum component FlaC
VIAAEKQVEADLKELLDCLKQLPSSGPSKDNKDQNQQGRERELNRIIAELKMIRMLQTHVTHDTKQTDDQRTAELDRASTELQQRIQTLHDRQQDVYDVTDKLNTQRGNEVQQ